MKGQARQQEKEASSVRKRRAALVLSSLSAFSVAQDPIWWDGGAQRFAYRLVLDPVKLINTVNHTFRAPVWWKGAWGQGVVVLAECKSLLLSPGEPDG